MRKLSRRKFIGSSSALAAAGLGLPGQSILAQPQADLRGAAPDYVVINARVFTSDPETPAQRPSPSRETVFWRLAPVQISGLWPEAALKLSTLKACLSLPVLSMPTRIRPVLA